MPEQEFLKDTPFWLVQDKPSNTDGTDKIVYKVTDGKQFFAAKIFRRVNTADCDEQPINRSRRATEELACYRAYKQSTLTPYVPLPVDLIREQGKVTGLLVEWKEGDELNDYNGQLLLPPETIDTLEQNLLLLPKNLWLAPDCMDDYNICLGPKGLWFAELMICQYASQKEYQETVHQWMDILRAEYVIK